VVVVAGRVVAVDGLDGCPDAAWVAWDREPLLATPDPMAVAAAAAATTATPILAGFERASLAIEAAAGRAAADPPCREPALGFRYLP
jgi:hypothetical protein